MGEETFSSDILSAETATSVTHKSVGGEEFLQVSAVGHERTLSASTVKSGEWGFLREFLARETTNLTEALQQGSIPGREASTNTAKPAIHRYESVFSRRRLALLTLPAHFKQRSTRHLSASGKSLHLRKSSVRRQNLPPTFRGVTTSEISGSQAKATDPNLILAFC